jgi:hypothetical protein
VSDYTVVEKEQLLNFRAFIWYLSASFGISFGSSIVGIFTGEMLGIFLGLLWFLAGAVVLYMGAGKFPNIDQAIEDAKGENR